MGYPFSSQLLKGFRNWDAPRQLATVHGEYWSDELLQLFKEFPPGPFFADLVGLLGKTEEGAYGGECFKPMAPICVEMSTGTDETLIADFYALNQQLVGTFLMHCMRINNRQNHDSAALRRFKILFDALGIKVVGPWDKCVAIASFGATSFGDGTLTVEL
jgi:hypothetical protein